MKFLSDWGTSTSHVVGRFGSRKRAESSVILVISAILLNLIIICDCVRENAFGIGGDFIDVSMPGVRPTQDDHYLCTAVNIESRGTQYINAYEPKSNSDRAHHMLLFTCDDVPEDLSKDGWW
jgi:hypothetical protein